MVPDKPSNPDMPTAAVILPHTTYRATDFLRAAEGLGVDLVVVSDQPAPIDMGDRYLHVDCSQPDEAAQKLLELADRVPLDGVVAADDAGVVVAAIAAGKLGLAGNEREAAEATRNKAVQRELMARAEVPQPEFILLQPGETDVGDVTFPVVIKPLDRSAGQGVIRVDFPEQLAETAERVRRIVGESAPLLVESYLAGSEVAVEGLMIDGQLDVLALFDKPDASEGPSFEETILVTPSLLSEAAQTECARVAAAALRAIGIQHGPVHVELKVDGHAARVIEVAGRSIGGLCSRSLSFGLMGTTLETLIIRNALGLDKPELSREQVASGVLMIPVPEAGVFTGLGNEDRIRSLSHVTGIELTAPPGTRLDPPPVGDRYLGFVFARAYRVEEVTAALRAARDLIQVNLG